MQAVVIAVRVNLIVYPLVRALKAELIPNIGDVSGYRQVGWFVFVQQSLNVFKAGKRVPIPSSYTICGFVKVKVRDVNDLRLSLLRAV